MLKVLFSVVQDNEQLKEETGNEVSSAHVSMFLTLMIRGLIRVVKVLFAYLHFRRKKSIENDGI